MRLSELRARLARWIEPTPKRLQRSYQAAAGGRLTDGWRSSNSSADTELAGSLQKMRGRSRALVRDFGYAKRAKVIVQNNVVGTGIGMQCQVKNRDGKLIAEINDAAEYEWCEWMAGESCHTGGVLHFHDLERLAMGQLFEAGEVFVRKHYRAFGNSRIPFALEVIEPERLAEEFLAPLDNGGRDIRMGVEVDPFHRPLAYWIRELHPGDIRARTGAIDRLLRVPADQIYHLRIVDRWPQTRGEPWMHTAARRLNDMDGYSEAEIVAARGAAAYMGFIRSPDVTPMINEGTSAQREIRLEAGIMEQLPPGWDITMNNPNRPNPAMDGFMRLMLREVAAGTGTSYESLSRDYSQSNYSSSRLALLDDRDLWRVLQQWFLRVFRLPLHREWMSQAVLAGAIPGISVERYTENRRKFEAVLFKPRGWSWIDPTKEVEAFKEAVKAGFSTVSDVIAQTAGGLDVEDVLTLRRQELDQMAEKNLVFDTDPSVYAPPEPEPAPAPEPEPEAEQPEAGARVLPLRSTQ